METKLMCPKKPIMPEKRKRYSGKNISDFAINVQKRRVELGLSQLELANKIGVAPSRISEIEAGRHPSNPDRIIALAKALQTDINWLFGFTPD